MTDPAALRNKLPNQFLAIWALLGALDVVERLGETTEQAKAIGNARDANPYAECWFDAATLTLTVRLHTPTPDRAPNVLACLIENGCHGFIGPFEVDKVDIKDDGVVVYLRQGSDREPLDDPEALVTAAARLMP